MMRMKKSYLCSVLLSKTLFLVLTFYLIDYEKIRIDVCGTGCDDAGAKL